MPELAKTMKGATGKRMQRNRQKSRRYHTGSAIWRRIRKAQLQRQPLCEHCLAKGNTTPATVVDHIDGNSWNDTPENYQSLCKQHHDRKTAKENGAFGNRPGRGDTSFRIHEAKHLHPKFFT